MIESVDSTFQISSLPLPFWNEHDDPVRGTKRDQVQDHCFQGQYQRSERALRETWRRQLRESDRHRTCDIVRDDDLGAMDRGLDVETL